ncbi:hypothetical protein SDC9_53068 [bioreactor metagenome]|uniref:Uncharacterized protein n=1 Tax=bioreactor metagenome TaxID=1076179 RepID=A0A644WS93_9ZZZZ
MIRYAVLLVLCCLLFVNSDNCYAQKAFSPSTKYERTILKEGNLVYVQKENGRILRLEVENIKFDDLSLDLEVDAQSFDKMNSQELYRNVFSKERAKELENHRLICHLHFNGKSKKMQYVSFVWLGEGEFPFKLSELKKLEDIFVNYPYKMKPIDKPQTRRYLSWTCPVIFKNIYKN